MKKMTFILDSDLMLRGWENYPFCILHADTLKTDSFTEEQFDLLKRLDGITPIDQEKLTKAQNDLLQKLLSVSASHRAHPGEVLNPKQRYKKYPAIYKHDCQWSITGRCNFRCRHCFMSSPVKAFKEPDLEECLSIVRQLKQCGVHTVTLTGGEPLVSPYLFDILKALKEYDIRVKGIYSNGALVSEKLLDRLEELELKPAFMMSFDGTGWHDWLRGNPGAEEKVLHAYRLLSERGFETTSSMCLHRHNLNTVSATIRMLAELNCGNLKISRANPSGLWAKETEHFITSDEMYQALYETIIPEYFRDKVSMSVDFGGLLKVNMPERALSIPPVMAGSEAALDRRACGAVANSLYISPEGKVLPCMAFCGSAFEESCPSLREQPLSAILSGSPYTELCRTRYCDVLNHNEKCLACSYKALCGGGCRQAAVGENGLDFLAPSPEACYFFENGWYEKALELVRKYG